MLEQTAEMANPKLLSPLALAFLGDAVYEICARRKIVGEGNCPVNQMHRKSVGMVCAKAQSAALEKLFDLLTEEEQAVFKRGRNAHSASSPKHTELVDYRRATGMEALFGYLYLQGRMSRIEELFELAVTSEEREAF
ncbi:Mini-ribonuclease 3 [Marasmitruncus massiliensis]|jgi:ribonuclease-3 family protein|uniref:Mini-ribonuclease 3 n=1 Tax=Marasmitruncus massiliensis TaxID=1944642 RepID=UPI000C7A9D90|nr:ribonuclease III domain-containing protein [Marasmitruncus massiliensis]MBE6907456.1 ribonuclease III [Oscillospiraceae bacterium]